jgi:hypothetical protein
MLCPFKSVDHPAGGLLKEAVDDLEWPGGSVVIKLTRDPAAISMVARGTGSLEVIASLTDCAHMHAHCAVAEEQSAWWHAAQARSR